MTRAQAKRLARPLTKEMERVLGIVRSERFAAAGVYIANGCRHRDIAAATLRALAARRLVTLQIGPDGGVMARPLISPLR